jgi:hypothetical protein
MGQPYYRFDQGGWRFLVLDSMIHDDETVYRVELHEVQLGWLKEQLQETDKTTSVDVENTFFGGAPATADPPISEPISGARCHDPTPLY